MLTNWLFWKLALAVLFLHLSSCPVPEGGVITAGEVSSWLPPSWLTALVRMVENCCCLGDWLDGAKTSDEVGGREEGI